MDKNKNIENKETHADDAKGKHPGGRPPLWATVEDFEKATEGFFDWCETGDSIVGPYIPDVEALTMYLKTSRKVLSEYEKKDKFSNAIKDIKDKIAFYKKQLAFQGKIPSAVFCFDFKNNHGYTDKTEIDQNVKAEITEVTRKIIRPNIKK
jgi:hypothetical protein